MPPNNRDELRVGVVGGGFIGRTVGRQFRADPRTALVALADVSDEALADAGETLGVPADGRYQDYERMLAATELDAVLVGTPHAVHYEQVRAALDRGLHVLCDKPLTVDAEEAAALADRAETGESVLMVGYQRHLNPAFQRARERWRGNARRPRFVTAEITQDWYEQFGGTWRTDPDLSGGGILYDTGSHLLDVVLWTTGLDPVSVAAEMTFADDDRRVDRRATLSVEFETGATATLSVYGDAPCVREHVHIWDDEGAVYLEGRQWERRTLRTVDAESTDHVPYLAPHRQRNKAEAFVETVRSGEAPPATARDALRVTALTEAAYEAARTGERTPVKLPPGPSDGG